MTTARERYNMPPNYQGTDATHFVHFPWQGRWPEDNWESVPELESRDLGENQEPDIVNNRCAKLYADISGTEGVDLKASLSHKSLVVVIRERVGTRGGFHYVRVTSTNPSVDGMDGYIDYRELQKLPGIPYSLPVVFNCIQETDKPKDFCSIATQQWFKTTEPYLDTFDCNYKICVTTIHSNTGGDSGLKRRMAEQIPVGVMGLLTYYDKIRTPQKVEELLNAFKFAEATSWNLDLRDHTSRLKVLVSVPARYFDAIRDVPQDLSSVDDGVDKHAILESSTLEKNIERLTAKMRSWHRSNSWQKSRSLYNGPSPLYNQYNFLEEATRLELFLSRLRRLLALNGKSIRPRSADRIEVGLSAENELKYVLLMDDTGSHKMKIGLESLKRLDPFDNPRTMGYVFFLFRISNEFKESGELRGGWPIFLEKFTSPPPEKSPSSGKKKCKATISDPLKCMPKDFQEFSKRHLNNVKCEELPPHMKSTPLEIGANEIETFYQSIQDGDWKNYKDRYATFRDQASNIRRKVSTEKFKADIIRENRRFGGGLGNVGDPFVESLPELLEKASPGEAIESFGEEALNKFMGDVVVKLDIKQIISKLHQCLCSQHRVIVQDLIDDFGDPRHPAVKSAELAGAALGCDNVCQVLPILCNCIPIPWPLQFDIPRLNIPDLLKYIAALIIDAIITAVFKYLLELIKAFVASSLDCDRTSNRSKDFFRNFNNRYPFESSLSDEEIEDALADNDIPESLVDFKKLNALLNDTVHLLSPREFCELISGEPTLTTLQAVHFLIREKHPDFLQNFPNHEAIKNLYSSIGDMIDPEICENIDELITALPVEPGNYICDETTLREDINLGRATREQITQALLEASKCNADKLESITNLVQNLSAGNLTPSEIIPKIFITPDNPNGIIPRDPPPIKYLSNVTNKSVFDPIQDKFYGEMNDNLTTLITVKEGQVDPNSELNGAARAFQIAGVDVASAINEAILGKLDKTVAGGVGEILRSNAVFIGDISNLEDVSGLGDQGFSLVLDLPRRKKYQKVTQAEVSAGNNLYTSFPIPGISDQFVAPSSNRFLREEQIRIGHSICNDFERDIHISRLRDVFTVRIQDIGISEERPIEIMTFDGKKMLEDSIKNKYGGFKTEGLRSPPRELFDFVIGESWRALEWGTDFRNSLRAPTRPLRGFHTSNAFDFNTRNIASRLALLFSKSRLIDSKSADSLGRLGAGVDFDTAFENLKSIKFVPNVFCDPREPGLLNIDDILEEVGNRYNNDLEEDETIRYVNSSLHGIIMLIVRVFCIHTVLNGVFPFSLLKAEDILTSDLMVSYLFNSFRSEMHTQVSIEYPDLYEDMKSIIGEYIAQRKYLSDEEFFDPFTNEPVDVKLDPSYVRNLVESSQHDPTGIRETIDIEDIEEGEQAEAQGEGLESTLKCYVAGVDVEYELPNFGCIQETESESLNEIVNRAISNPSEYETLSPDDNPFSVASYGKKPIGFMEYFFKEQLKSISGELEVMLGTEINTIDEFVISGVSKEIDLATFSNGFEMTQTPVPRFFEDQTYSIEITEEDIRQTMRRSSDYSDLPRTGRDVLVERSGRLYRAALDDDNEFSPEENQRRFELWQEVIDDKIESLVPSQQSESLFPKFNYLKNGGFITETFIEIEDLNDEEWDVLIESRPNQGQMSLYEFFKGVIKNRPDSLRGYVSLRDWKFFVEDFVSKLVEEQQSFRDYGTIEQNLLREILYDFTSSTTFFKKMNFCKRMSYVYPLSDASPAKEDLEALLTQAGSGLGMPFEEAKKKKSYFLTETLERTVELENSERGSLASLFGIEGSYSKTYNIFAVPLIESKLEVEPIVITTSPEEAGFRFRGQNLGDGIFYDARDIYEKYSGRLSLEMAQTPEYKALFKYIFPVDRFSSMLTIYISDHVGALPGREELFDGTKELLFYRFQSLKKLLNENWYEIEEPKPKWWEKQYSLSVPGILFATPWKILQALVTLVKPFDWILGQISRFLPELPPYESKRGPRCPTDP